MWVVSERIFLKQQLTSHSYIGIALAGNYIDAGSLETARQECDHKDRGQYSRYREIVETVLQPHFPAEMDLSAEDMEWDEWKAQATWIP